MNAKKALELIKQHGIYELGEDDGCPCTNFEICGVNVGVSCHKSEHCIRVYSHHLFRDPFALEPIAVEVAVQVGQEGYKIRFCEYSCDHVDGKWVEKKWTKTQKCCYCGAPRPDEDAYLCADCLNKPEARGSYPWGLQGNMISPEERERSLFAPLFERTQMIVLGEKELRAMAREMNAKPN